MKPVDYARKLFIYHTHMADFKITIDCNLEPKMYQFFDLQISTTLEHLNEVKIDNMEKEH